MIIKKSFTDSQILLFFLELGIHLLWTLSLQTYLNYLANYVPNTWNYEHGCSHCDDDVLDLSELKVSATTQIISLFICCFLWSIFQSAAVCFNPPLCGHWKGWNFWHEPSIGFCLDSQSDAQLVLFQQITKRVGASYIALPTIINAVCLLVLLDPFKRT